MDKFAKQPKMPFTSAKMFMACSLLCAYIQEVYPEEYKKYSDELEPWMKSKGIKLT